MVERKLPNPPWVTKLKDKKLERIQSAAIWKTPHENAKLANSEALDSLKKGDKHSATLAFLRAGTLEEQAARAYATLYPSDLKTQVGLEVVAASFYLRGENYESAHRISTGVISKTNNKDFPYYHTKAHEISLKAKSHLAQSA